MMKTYKNIITARLFYYIFLYLFLCAPGFEFPLGAQTQKTWQWVKQLGGSSWDISAGVVCDSKNNLYLAGSYLNTLNCSSKKLESSGDRDLFIAAFGDRGDLKNIVSAGGEGPDNATCICVTYDDMIAVGGMISDSATFGKITVSGTGKRLYVAAMDVSGSFKWVSTISMTGNASLDISGTDKSGTVYASGIFTGTLEAEDKSVTSNGRKDIFLVQISPSGKIMNLYSFGSDEDDILGSMSVDGMGDIAVAGTFGKPFEAGGIKLAEGPKGTKTNAFIGKFGRDLYAEWINIIPGEEYCSISSLKYDNSGNLYAAGSFNSKLHAGDTILLSNGYTDGFIIKYLPDGRRAWSRTFGSWYYDYTTHLNVDNLGGAIITGSAGDTISIDSLMIEPASKNNSALVIQFSSNGKATWADCISGTGRNFSDGSVLDKQGNLYFTGAFRNTFEKGDDALTSFGDQDIFLAKYFNCTETRAEISGERSFCPGEGTELSVRKSYTDVVWNDTILNKYSITAYKPGLYWVQMLDKKGCLVTDTINITQNNRPEFSLGRDTTILVTDSLMITAPGSFLSYRWHDYSIEQEYLAKSIDGKTGTEEYWLTVTDSLSCTYTDTIAITFLKAFDWIDLDGAEFVAYPNPTTDNVKWYLKTDEVCRLVIEITDENGRKIYHQYVERYIPGEEKEIFMGNMSAGIYNIRVSDSSPGRNYKSVRVIKR